MAAYHDYENLDNAKFRYDIVTAATSNCIIIIKEYTIFSRFNCHVPIKKGHLC